MTGTPPAVCTHEANRCVHTIPSVTAPDRTHGHPRQTARFSFRPRRVYVHTKDVYIHTAHYTTHSTNKASSTSNKQQV